MVGKGLVCLSHHLKPRVNPSRQDLCYWHDSPKLTAAAELLSACAHPRLIDLLHFPRAVTWLAATVLNPPDSVCEI